ncbi:MAG TPA: trypsin-like peptidase domain-containing protein [Wenzhouxiangella sp.]|nr:trypsin-like peptidase domain-containing protein [Wenzhouxiangella sp.]
MPRNSLPIRHLLAMSRPLASLIAIAALLVALISMPASVAHAQKMHRWVDEHGQVHFSQTPPPDQASQESEMVRYGKDKRRNVDRACCESVREVATTASSYLQRGLTFSQLQQQFPPSEYPYLTEIFNYVSLNASAGDSPLAIGSRAFNACLNRSFQACRVETGRVATGGSTVSSAGSGVVIGDGLVLTNDHVISGCREITVSDQQIGARVLATDRGTDLAALEARLESMRPVSIAGADRPVLGQSIVVAGYPFSSVLESLNFTTGTVSSEKALKGSNTLFQITAPIQPGNSGGPVFDSSGHLIGIVVSQLANIPMLKAFSSVPQNVNFAITPVAVKTFLRENDIAFLIAGSKRALTTEAIAEQARQNTVRIFCYP